AEARVTGDRVGEVELPIGLEPLALLAGEDRVDDLSRVLPGELRVLVEPREAAAHTHERLRAGAEVQIGSASRHDFHQEVGEINVHMPAHRRLDVPAGHLCERSGRKYEQDSTRGTASPPTARLAVVFRYVEPTTRRTSAIEVSPWRAFSSPSSRS